MNVGDLLVLNAGRYPKKTAMVYRGRRFTYLEFNQRVNRLAHNLMDLGVRKGDRVGYMFFNSNQSAETFFATQKIGALAVPMSFRLVSREVKWILDNASCKAFVYGDAFKEVVEPVKEEFETVELEICSGKSCPSGAEDFERLCTEGTAEEPGVEVGFEDWARIQFTGGTTGLPKGAVHTHRSSLFTCITGLIRMSISEPSEVMLNQVPMFHNTGVSHLLFSVATGACFVIVETFDPVEILKLIEEERGTYLCLLPPVTYLRLMDVPNLEDFDRSSVRKLLTSAGSLPQSVVMRLYDTFPDAVLLYGWGLTETGPGGGLHRIPRSMVENEPEKVKSVGLETPFLQVRVVDGQGRDVGPGEVGEAIIRSPSNMEGYFGQPELTAQTIKDGWVYTGDLVKKDEDGYIYIVDRKKDMIKSGGENVYAQEVEAIILTHPSVENCAVIGVPDPVFQEAVMAVVKLREGAKATEEEIIDHCKKSLSSYKKPRRVDFVEGFPLDSIGKIQKFRLREQYGQ
jgi:acyl-CoA synthetase (AMP-forming)/AMP-acid ligase II